MVVIDVGPISVYFDSIEVIVLYHLLDVGIEIILIVTRPLQDWLELLLGGCVSSEKPGLLPASLLVMRYVYLLNLHCRERSLTFLTTLVPPPMDIVS